MTEHKIAEIHATEDPWLACPQLPNQRRTIDPKWVAQQLSHTQQQFLTRTSAHLRPHPRTAKNHVIEVLVDQEQATEQTLTLAALLFPR